jgi:hypothetical protein
MNSEREIRDHQNPEREPRNYQRYGREIRDYLLGVLPEKQREEIEQRFFSDDDFHLEVEIVEEELFDDYLQTKLPGPERRLFETNFLASPVRRQRLQFTRAFYHKTSPKTEIPVTPVLPLPARSFTARLYPYSLAACLLVVAVLGTMDYQLSRSVQEEHDKTASLAQQLENSRAHQQLENAGRQFPAASNPNSIFLATLVPKGSRSGPQPQLIVPKDILALHFRLIVPANFRGPVRIDLLNDAGQSIFSQQGAQVERAGSQGLVSALVEARYLPPGDYLLRLTPQDSSSFPEYAFQVLANPNP